MPGPDRVAANRHKIDRGSIDIGLSCGEAGKLYMSNNEPVLDKSLTLFRMIGKNVPKATATMSRQT